jgi:hypothetical protein
MEERIDGINQAWSSMYQNVCQFLFLFVFPLRNFMYKIEDMFLRALLKYPMLSMNII